MPYIPYSSQYPYSQYPQYSQFQQTQQQSNLIHVQNEMQAREWAVAPGCSLMFIDDNLPYIYTKSAGTSQLEPAVFKIFKVSEIGTENAQISKPAPTEEIIPDHVQRAEIEAILADIEAIKEEIESIKKKRPKKEVIENESAE